MELEMNPEGDNQIRDYSAVLEAKYGAPGTPERAKFDEEAYAFYTSQILLDARKNARLTQAQLAERIGANKSYISKIEKGITVPTVATFYRIVNALGLSVELMPPVPL
jgi:DNA-binding XRE family transcriptional regulator